MVIVACIMTYSFGATDVHFIIKKTSYNSYEIVISRMQSFPGVNQWPQSLIKKQSNGVEDIFLQSSEIQEVLNNAAENETTKVALRKLDEEIRKNIINSIVYQQRLNPFSSDIDVTVDLAPLTTFNKAYRELYNAVRDFSKSLAGHKELSYMDKIKKLFGYGPQEVYVNPVPDDRILPDLAPEASIFKRAAQSHPKMTGAAAAASAATIGAYILSRKLKESPTLSSTN